MAAGGHGTKAVIAAMAANAGIAVAKFIGFLLTQSSSMLAESVHSVADTGNQALLLLGGKRARRQATPEHPFGYGRERYFWSFIVALILFSLGGMFALYEGYEKIRHPHEIESVGIAVGILVFGILLEGFSFRTAVVESDKVRDRSTSWWSFIRRSKHPELPVVLLEDLGAMVGLVLALLAVTVSHLTGDAVWDGIGTMTIGVLLVIIAVILAIEMKGLLIGEAASPTDQQRIAAAITVEPSVTRLLHMRTQHLGPDELLVGAKIELLGDLTVAEAGEAVNRIEASVRRAVPTARILYLEPDVFRTADDHGAPAIEEPPGPGTDDRDDEPAEPPSPGGGDRDDEPARAGGDEAEAGIDHATPAPDGRGSG